ncbi:MAG: ABC transporter substrate-binding protein [Deltaproteobacteria bacterium]|nr:ABC transporter substrate-binding protein [Deltaproteobacteria bacterium]
MKRPTMLTLGAVLGLGLVMGTLVAGRGGAQRKFTGGVSLASSTNPFYIAMEQGMRERARELQVELRVVRAEEDQVRQLDGAQDLIQRKVDLILISPITATGAVPAYEASRAARIPILSVARSVDPKHQVAFVGSDWVEQGRRIGRWTVERLKGRGKVGMLLGPAGASFAQEMERGYKEVLGRQPGMQVVAGHHSPLTRADGLRLAEDILTAHPDVAMLYGTNDELALGAVQAVKAQKKTGVLVTGFNGVPPAIEAVRKGELAMTIALKPKSWGRKAVEAAVDHLNGKTLPKIVEIDTVVVDESNVARLKREDLL